MEIKKITPMEIHEVQDLLKKSIDISMNLTKDWTLEKVKRLIVKQQMYASNFTIGASLLNLVLLAFFEFTGYVDTFRSSAVLLFLVALSLTVSFAYIHLLRLIDKNLNVEITSDPQILLKDPSQDLKE